MRPPSWLGEPLPREEDKLGKNHVSTCEVPPPPPRSSREEVIGQLPQESPSITSNERGRDNKWSPLPKQGRKVVEDHKDMSQGDKDL